MIRHGTLLLKIIISAGAVCSLMVAFSKTRRDPQSFTEALQDYLTTHATGETTEVYLHDPRGDALRAQEGRTDSLRYLHGDWQKYVTREKYRMLLDDMHEDAFKIQEEGDVNITTYGSMKYTMLYGKSRFKNDDMQQFDTDKAVSRVIQDGFTNKQEVQLHMEGRVGKRLTVFIDHDSRKTNNQYYMQYRAVNEDEVIREINAGQIDIKMNNSKYAVYDDNTAKALGIDLTLRKKKLTVKAFGSMIQGVTEVERFRGTSAPGSIKLSEFQYMRNRYFQLEPFKRYDGRTTPPVLADTPYDTMVTFTSRPADPSKYAPYLVNIDPGGFELYMDDMNPLNNYNATNLSIAGYDHGWYHKLVPGADYIINYSTGMITFLKTVPENARIYAVYRMAGGTATSDPTARTEVVAGKLFVFLKYGTAINEDLNRNYQRDANEPDKNNDGLLNLDIYEVRSFYRIGESQITETNFNLSFYQDNALMTSTARAALGRYQVDFQGGVISFVLREPFRENLRAAGGNTEGMYCEAQSTGAYLYSKYNIRADYFRDARTYQLKHGNIIPESVRVKVNGRELSPSLYVVDMTSGLFQFNNPGNPVISQETEIEIKYEYMPFGGHSQQFVGGVRADYKVNRHLSVGGTVLMSRDSSRKVIPTVGAEPEQKMVFEGDAKVSLSGEAMSGIINSVIGTHMRSLPFSFEGYAEYARSFRAINTFGKALIDDMESIDEVIGISLSDKDWILGSMPSIPTIFTQADRGLLYYSYFRDPSAPGTLKGLGFPAASIGYDTKPGPYNVAEGHVDNSVQAKDSQISLVFNFEFPGATNMIPVVTRRLSSAAVDFSTLQYLEVWYRSGGGSGTVEMAFDIGKINEDSDGDGFMSTEDLNHNGVLDADPAAGIFEDVGYLFNGNRRTRVGSGPRLNAVTIGDGVLNNEDLNGNGVLDTAELSVALPGEITAPSSVPPAGITVDLADTGWKQARIYLDKSVAAYTNNPLFYEAVLREVEAVRLRLRRGTASAGSIFVDSVRFVSSRWKGTKIDGVPMEAPGQFKVSIVDTLSDPEYRNDSFLMRQRSTFKSLHGERNDADIVREKESALQIEYNLANRRASVSRKYVKAMDLRFYKTMNLWFNYREFGGGDIYRVRVGSSERDYLEYEFSPDAHRAWREITLRLNDSSGGRVRLARSVGNPDLKRIVLIEIEAVANGTGRFWVNDIYVSDPMVLKDDAHWYEAEIKFNRPLFYTKSGVPVISDLNIKFIQKGHGANFSTVGKSNDEVREEYYGIFSSMKILPNWGLRADYIVEETATDGLNEKVDEARRGNTSRKSFFLETNYASNIPAVPSVTVKYKQEDYANTRKEFVASVPFNRNTDRKTYTPTILVEEKLDRVLGGSLSASLFMDMAFREERIRRGGSGGDAVALSSAIALEESEKRQQGLTTLGMMYQNAVFYVNPRVEVAAHEIVELKGKSSLNDTRVLSDVRGNFHAPFTDADDSKFVERNKKGSLALGVRKPMIVRPEMKIDMSYYENKFRDYDEAERLLAGRFSRSKDARGYVANRIDLPFFFTDSPGLKFIRSLNVSYLRSASVQESDVPYEGEKTDAFQEEYGVDRVYNGISDLGLNLYRFPPWHFFNGRGTCANARDYVNERFNSPLYYGDGAPATTYNNGVRLIDNLSYSGAVDFDSLSIVFGGSFNQVSERQMVYGIPQQVVTINQNITCNFDLMKMFTMGFFRPNTIGIPHHAAYVNATYGFTRNMFVTSNIEEDVHTHGIGLTFKRDRASLSFKGTIDFRYRWDREYIPLDDADRDSRDDVYVANINAVVFHEIDKSYTFSVVYETDVQWLYRLFSFIYQLTAYPIFSIEYAQTINRYDYSLTVSPEPYDLQLITGKLTLDLHKNVQGGISTRYAIEKWLNRETQGVYKEVESYEIGFGFMLLF